MNPEIIAKLKVMLNRNGRTEAEADTFQIMAAALADRHGIDLASLDAAEERERCAIMHKQVGEWGKCPPEADFALVVCKRFFEVDAVTHCGWTERVEMVGTAHHIEVAEHVFHFLVREFRWQWNHRRGRCRKRKDFLYGCLVSLTQKLDARFARPAAGGALEVSWKAKRQAYMQERWPSAKTSSVAPQKPGAAAARGFQAGRDIEIRPAVKPGEAKGQELLPGFERRLLG